MSINRSKILEESSSQKLHHSDKQQRQGNQAPQPISQQQEQQHLQLYWYNNNNDEPWTQDDEEKVLQSWASRTFSATCYKFTIQNDPAARQSGPLYSFLENWQLHTMYNKSQKILLGIADRRPCVLLTGDDFMFTPPPLKDDDATSANSLYQQAQMDYLDDEDDDFGEEGGTSGGGGMDEHLWMLYQPPSSPLHVVNASNADEESEENDADLRADEQEIMVTGRGQSNTRTSTIEPSAQRLLVSPALVKWYQTVEPPATIIQQRCTSTIIMTATHDDYHQPIDTITSTTKISISHENDQSTLIADQGNDDNTSTITTATDNSNTSNASTRPMMVLTWRQWLQQGVMFLSQRMVEVAYLVAELAESLATTEQNPKEEHHPHLLMTHTYQEGRLKSSTAAPRVLTGHYIVQLFRVWRVFFLGVETMMHRLFSLDSSSHRVVVLPLLTKSPSTF